MNPLNDLLSNLAIVAIAISAWTFTHRRLIGLSGNLQNLIFGVSMAVGTFAVMHMPFQFIPGVKLDARYTFLAVSAFFGGPVAALPPLLTAIVLRVWIGGVGVSVAIPNIVAASLVGLIGYRLNRSAVPRIRLLVLLSCSVAVAGTLGFYVVLPIERWWHLTGTITLPFALILFASTWLASIAMVEELKRQAVTSENLIYRAVIDALPDCLNAKDIDGRFLTANPATARALGADDPADLIGRTDADFFDEATAGAFRVPELDVMRTRAPLIIEQKFARKDGHTAWHASLKAPFTMNGQMLGIVTHNRDVTEQKRLEEELGLVQRRLSGAVESMADGLALFDRQGLLVFRNERFVRMFPPAPGSVNTETCITHIVRMSLHGDEAAEVGEDVDLQIKTRAADLLTPGNHDLSLPGECWIEARTRDAGEDGVMIVFSDVSDRKQQEAKLQRLNRQLADLANTDRLTSLFNRRGFDLALETAMTNAHAANTDLGLILVDIDHFKAFNDTYGHLAGDDCLRRVAAAIAETLEPFGGSLAARYGGEEIASILPLASIEETASVARLLCAAVRNLGIAHSASEKGVVTASAGAASLKSLGGLRRKDDLVAAADSGLYAAKSAGRDTARTVVSQGRDEAAA